MEQKIPTFYIIIYKKLKELKKPILNISDFTNIWKGYRLTKDYIKLIFVEFERLGLIERRGKGGSIIILKHVNVPDPLENRSKFYHYIGAW